MANRAQSPKSVWPQSYGLPAFAVALFYVLTVMVSQSAQAQTFTVLHNFTGGADGDMPYSGVTLDSRRESLRHDRVRRQYRPGYRLPTKAIS
jgi:hypothetical protein